MVVGTQEAKAEKVLRFLKAPSKLSDKNLAAKVCAHYSLWSIFRLLWKDNTRPARI